jgi:hypothetical protein
LLEFPQDLGLVTVITDAGREDHTVVVQFLFAGILIFASFLLFSSRNYMTFPQARQIYVSA